MVLLLRRPMRLKWKIGFLVTALLFVLVAAFISKQREAVVLPLAFVGFTNVAGETSALFRFEIPPAPGFLNRQTWEMPKSEIALKLADGQRVTNSAEIKPADFQMLTTATNAAIQIRIGLPTNATALSVDYTIRLSEGASVGSLDLYLPVAKRILYRSGEVTVNSGAR